MTLMTGKLITRVIITKITASSIGKNPHPSLYITRQLSCPTAVTVAARGLIIITMMTYDYYNYYNDDLDDDGVGNDGIN